MQTYYAAILVLVAAFGFAEWGEGSSRDPLSLAADYYYSKHDYNQALQIWSGVLKRQPDSLAALFRVSELKLMFEGRSGSREVVRRFLELNQSALTHESQRAIKEKLASLQSIFLTDDGQGAYLQAVSRIRRKDCLGAMALLNQAAAVEGGNIRVLWERAKCEKFLKLYDKFYDTMKGLYETNPYDVELLDNLSEAHVYNREFGKVVSIFRDEPESLRSARQKTSFAIALAETGEFEKALPILQSLIEREKQAGFHPVVFYAVGKILSHRMGAATEAGYYLERFLASSNRPENALIDGWDPFRTQEKAELAKPLLNSLRRRG